jgi:hypothetical protein
MKARAPNPSLWAERYESLRRHALQAHQILGSDPLGLALLVQGGTAHWMRRWAASSPVPSKSPPLPAALSLPMPPDWQRELTLVLGQMTLQHLTLNL